MTKLIAPSPVGVIVTLPVLSCVTSKRAETFDGGSTLAKSVLSLKSSSHPTKKKMMKIEQFYQSV